MISGGNIDPDPSAPPDSIEKKLAELAKVVRASSTGQRLYESEVGSVLVAQNRLTTLQSANLSSLIDSEVSALDVQQGELNTALNSLLDPNSDRFRQYSANLQQALIDNNPEAFLSTVAGMNNILNDANQKLSSTLVNDR